MISKTLEEKEALKSAKAAFKKGRQMEKIRREERKRTDDEWVELKPAEILDDDYPVHWDYFYDVGGKIIRSDIKGTVRDLKKLHNVSIVRRVDFGTI